MQTAFGMGAGRPASDYIARNRLCACKDVACGDAVSRELTTWSEEYVKKLPPGSRMSAADDHAMQKIESQVRTCMQALRARDR